MGGNRNIGCLPANYLWRGVDTIEVRASPLEPIKEIKMRSALQLRVGDTFRMPAYDHGYRVWKVDGVHLGACGQESVVSLVAIDKSMPLPDGKIYVPTRIMEAANLERV